MSIKVHFVFFLGGRRNVDVIKTLKRSSGVWLLRFQQFRKYAEPKTTKTKNSSKKNQMVKTSTVESLQSLNDVKQTKDNCCCTNVFLHQELITCNLEKEGTVRIAGMKGFGQMTGVVKMSDMETS